ncbi:hypothetical protein OF83DRAFT_1169979 [Amylostereum chailletii]|nr:hypothetical protein OF83DRAFT_1169979 [Amylostereum chailletii]
MKGPAESLSAIQSGVNVSVNSPFGSDDLPYYQSITMSLLTEGGPNLDPVLIPVLLGSLAAWFLFGINVVQVYVYALHFPEDPKLVKVTVYGIFIVECFQIIVATAAPWYMLCKGWGNESSLTSITWNDPFIPLLDGFVGGWVQVFYAWRIYILGRSKTWTAVALGILPAWLMSSVVCDVIIAVCMVYVLFISRERIADVKITTTHKRITSLIRLSIETGSVTAAIAIFSVVSFISLKGTTLYIGLGLIVSKVYSNSFMVSLNSRIYAREANIANANVSSFAGPGAPLPFARSQIVFSPDMHVEMTRVSETFGDRQHKKQIFGHGSGDVDEIPFDNISQLRA